MILLISHLLSFSIREVKRRRNLIIFISPRPFAPAGSDYSPSFGAWSLLGDPVDGLRRMCPIKK